MENQTVLVVSVDKVSGREILALFKELGYTSLKFALGLKPAVAALKEGGVSLVAADCRAERVCGVRLLSGLRGSKAFATLPFLALFCEDDQELLSLTSADPAAAALTNGLTADSLKKALARLLDGSAAEPETHLPEGASPLSRALALIRAGQADQARSLLEPLAQGAEADQNLLMALAMACQAQGDAAAMDANLAKAIKAPPASPVQAAEGPPEEELPHVWAELSEKERRQKAFSHFLPSHDKREAYRLFVPDWKVKIKGRKAMLQTVDVSMTGIGFETFLPRPERGEKLVLSISARGEAILESVEVEVMHADSELLGCKFPDLDRNQEKALNSAMIQEQKVGAAASEEFADKDKEKPVIKLSF